MQPQAEGIDDEVISQEQLRFGKTLEEQLKPFAHEISTFYHRPFHNTDCLSSLLATSTGLLGFKDERSYLGHLLSLSAKEIQTHILCSLLVKGVWVSKAKDVRPQAETISGNPAQIREFIKELPIESGTKWNLSLILEDPLDHVQRYAALMERLLPLFEEVYEPVAEEVQTYGSYFVGLLNTEGIQKLNTLTDSMVNTDILEEESLESVLISALTPYTLLLVLSSEPQYLVWGLKVEESVRRIRELKENRLLERISLFKNLGDKTRYEVLKLFAAGETSTKEIAQALGVTSATVSYHINNLTSANILKMGKSNDRFGWVVNYDFIEEVIRGLKSDLGFPK